MAQSKPKDPTTSEKRDIQFSVKLSPGDLKFLEDIKAERGISGAEAAREFIRAFRNWFDLPGYMADELRAHMAKKGVTQLEIVQEAMARFYERLAHGADTKR